MNILPARVRLMALVDACVLVERRAGDEQNAAGQVSLLPSERQLAGVGLARPWRGGV